MTPGLTVVGVILVAIAALWHTDDGDPFPQAPGVIAVAGLLLLIANWLLA